jgi:hypothetical protein
MSVAMTGLINEKSASSETRLWFYQCRLDLYKRGLIRLLAVATESVTHSFLFITELDLGKHCNHGRLKRSRALDHRVRESLLPKS